MIEFGGPAPVARPGEVIVNWSADRVCVAMHCPACGGSGEINVPPELTVGSRACWECDQGWVYRWRDG